MANHSVRLPMRNRIGPQRKVNGDENAMSRHVRQSSSITGGAARVAIPPGHAAKAALLQRPALNEVTTTAVNRKENIKLNGIGKEKEVVDAGIKRSASTTFASGPQRVPLASTRAAPNAPAAAHARASSIRVQRPHNPPARVAHRVPVPVPQEYLVHEEDVDVDEVDMDVEYQDGVPTQDIQVEDDEAYVVDERDTEAMEPDAVEDEPEQAPRVWPEMSTERAQRYQREIDEIKYRYKDPVDEFDMTMVSEYAEDIFDYMNDLEDDVMPNPEYMEGQTEINWSMRQTLVDWLLQVHLRYHMLPETLWIAVNIVDRFLTKRIVSVLKLQLVGVTAMFVAAKYEEILAPSVDEFVYMTENGYSREEILKGERIVLQTLDFRVSHYCSPYSWMRKISKADDYDIQTRTLSKFLTEVTLLDYRFLRVKPSLVAAVGMYTARRMLGGDWNDAFVYHSGVTEEHVLPGHRMLLEKLVEDGFTKQHVCEKYSHKKFLKASMYAIEWAHNHLHQELAGEQMNLED
ncbi:cyclin [Rhodofomes roseus]|uniref:Cyclin n=1 Tax=Rhodofomes roseus TaxID=34475 RepID=A0A4Y9YBI5_9APHY|nr:cyclin [Rhodofomes roseus]KAH9838411.1 cyclin [Rhodofomes roseus]TFY58831.1 hypothetical protein EVJ58_g6163 [Rhodofomes roseus]